MSVAEIASELVYGGKVTLGQFAGMTLWQLNWVVGRKRDKHGNLVRTADGLPEGAEVDADGMRIVANPVSMAEAFMRVQRRTYRRTKEQARAAWRQWAAANPTYFVTAGSNG